MSGQARETSGRALPGPRSALTRAVLFRFCVESPFRDAFGPLSGAPGPRPRAGLRVRRSGARPGAFGPPSPGPLQALFINAKKS